MHGFRCYDNIHVCKLVTLHAANAYSAEREMSASACTRCMTDLSYLEVDFRFFFSRRTDDISLPCVSRMELKYVVKETTVYGNCVDLLATLQARDNGLKLRTVAVLIDRGAD